MRFELTRDPEEFASRARELLWERIECNVLATVTMMVLEGHHADPPPLFCLGVDRAGRVSWAALRTPTWPMIASELDPAAAPALVAQWVAEDPDLPGVNAQPGTSRAVAAAWRAETGGSTSCRTTMAMHWLGEVVDPPRPASGRLRVATAVDRPLMVEWWRGFARDAGVIGGDNAAGVVSRLDHGGLFIWEDPDPVSMVGITRPVAGVVRVGPVYTPPALRRNGYASAAVAEASRRALAAGADRCMLFTDLANPTSNKIYAEVGYRRFGDWEEHEFSRA
jgi:predicted GNAT family acetyltransferase